MQINHDLQTGMYFVQLRHPALRKYRMIRGRDRRVVQQKAMAQKAAWENQWERQRSKLEKLQSKEAEQRVLTSRTTEATNRTEKAKAGLERLKNLLAHATKLNPSPDFKELHDREQFRPREFNNPQPEPPHCVEGPKLLAEPKRPPEPKYPEKPSEDAAQYRPTFTLLDKLFQSRRERAIATAKALFEADLAVWERKKNELEDQHATELIAWEKKITETKEQNVQKQIAFEARTAKAQTTFETQLAAWKQEKEAFELEQKAAAESFKERQNKFNDRLKDIEKAYLEKAPKGVVEYCRLVLSKSDYPTEFPKTFELDYIAESKLLLVEYSLPVIDALPTVVEVKYQPANNKFKELFLSDAARKKLYDDVLYQITLRSLHELFKADRVMALDSVVFNGWVHGLNKATGKKVNTCVLSVHTKREAFHDLDLKNVDPKACFKLLKGVGSSELHGLAAIAPIMRIERKDKRFIEAYGVAGELDSAVNLAAMDWEDFEHLVRELFEKEFAQYGGEVKITQASRDGGVDAVAFDPDPIRGGKIVIQAKRYTNIVGLSAVRDLYGTVVNEGAIKGILVTTAAYGPDAYEFAKDKPLTLLNGSNLLHMLERHGHKAKIDLREAKRVLAQENRR